MSTGFRLHKPFKTNESNAFPRKRSLQVRVTKSSLKNAAGSLLRPPKWWRRLGIAQHTRVYVEPWENDRSDSIFYAPFSNGQTRRQQSTSLASDQSSRNSSSSSERRRSIEHPTAADFINIHPDRVPRSSLVDPSEDFEISFVGMVVPPFDFFRRNNNELLLFSLSSGSATANNSTSSVNSMTSSKNSSQRESESNYEKKGYVSKDGKHRNLHTKQNSISNAELIAGDLVSGVAQGNLQGGLHLDDIPTIHYDPDKDGFQYGTEPDTFVSIPASKSLFLQHEGKTVSETDNVTGSVPIRFTVMEIDRITKAQASAIACATQLGSMASTSSTVVPYANIVSWAFSFASTVSSRQLRKYSRPDFVMSTDVVFRLVKKQNNGTITDLKGDPIRFAGPYLQVCICPLLLNHLGFFFIEIPFHFHYSWS